MNETYYYNASTKGNTLVFSRQLTELLKRADLEHREMVLLCVGSDRSTGDSLGPLIGYKLQHSLQDKIHIYGTLKNPVHAVNLADSVEEIYSKHINPFIIAVDASLGSTGHVGYATICTSPLRPGIGVKKSLPEVGDLCITGIVNLSGSASGMLLQSTRLAVVMELADFISTGIFMAIHSYSSSSMTCISR